MSEKEINAQETKKDSQLEISSKEKILTELENSVNAIVIEDTEQFGKATELLKKIKKQITTGNKSKLAFTKPFRDLVSGINDSFKSIETRAKKIQGALESKILAYNKILQKKADEEAEKERVAKLKKIEDEKKAEKEKQAVLNSFLDDGKEPEIPEEKKQEFEKKIEQVNNNIQAPAMNSFKSGGVATSFKKVPVYKVVDVSLIPREYMQPDNTRIMQALNMGAREIPGLEITEEERIRSR
jgi:hypothetical protein